MELEAKVLRYKGRIVFEKLALPGFKRAPKLYQQNEACFMFVKEGEMAVRTPSQHFPIGREYGLLAKCFDYFLETSQRQQAENGPLEVLGVLLYPEVVEELFDFELSKSQFRVDFNAKQVQVDQLLAAFRDSIDILLDHPELADEALVKTKLREFVLLISKTQGAPSHLDFLSAMFHKTASDFRSTILHNQYASLSLDEFAFLCSMSVSSFKRKFKEVFGESPRKYLAAKKLQKSAQLLKHSDLRISEIAYDCGFESISAFNRNFKSHFGMSPSAFRLT